MKILAGCVLIVVLSGCIPIGFQAKTIANAAAGPAASACAATVHQVPARALSA